MDFADNPEHDFGVHDEEAIYTTIREHMDELMAVRYYGVVPESEVFKGV